VVICDTVMLATVQLSNLYYSLFARVHDKIVYY